MCDLCSKVRGNSKYASLLEGMLEEDQQRIKNSREVAENLTILNRMLFTTMNYPIKLVYPMFDARTAFSVPNHYYQNLFVGGERSGVSFAHGSMRSVFFSDERLVVFSKTVNTSKTKEFFTSFLLAHFEKDEYAYSYDNGILKISADVEKPALNLATKEKEKKKIKFNFVSKNVIKRIVTKERVLSSQQFKKVYGKYGGARAKAASMDMEGYAVTVPHFAPHPYLLQISNELGYSSNKDFQEKTIDYFKAHLGIE